MLLLVVNFHYVTESLPSAPRAIFPVGVDQLADQVRGLLETHEPVTRDELLAAVDGDGALPERGLMVTFDDGLRDHVELALPVLLGLGVRPVFFVSGRPHAEHRALHVHLVHHLREWLEPEDFESLLARTIAEQSVVVPDITTEDAQAMYRYDEPAVARVKYLLNVAIERNAAERLVEAMFAEAGPDHASFVDRLYMTDEHLRELEHEHAALGAHGYDHHPFAALGVEAKVADMARGAETLEAVTGQRPPMISYPYGSAAAVTHAVGDAAARLGFRSGFTMERAANRTLGQPLLLARIDTNDAPGGKRPLGALGARSRYFDEAAEMVGA